MKKGFGIIAALFTCCFLLAGCGSTKLPENIEVTTVALDGKGTITSYLVEDFEKDYYNISELSAMAVQEAEEYSEANEDEDAVALSVEQVELLGDGTKVLVQHVYRDAKTFADYNECELFFGSVAEAVEAGYDLSVLLTGVKDKAPLSQEELLDNSEKWHVLITDFKADVYCPYKVTHVGDGVVYREDGSVDTTQVEGVVVVLMK